MKRIIYTLCLATLLFPLGRMASGQINENKVVEPFVLPKNLIFVEVGGPARNALLFNYQRIIPITESAALTARVGVFGFGNSQPGGAEAQLDAAAGLGLLLSTQNQHNMEIEASYDRNLAREEDYRDRDQNRYLLTAGYRLQPGKKGKGFSMRVGLGMLVYTKTEEFFYDGFPSTVEESTGFYPMGYLGIGYAF